MHPNSVFRGEPGESVLEFVRERSFGVLTVAGPKGVLAAHVPFVLRETRILAHLMRVNPLTRHLLDGPTDVLLNVSGPDGYISPDWYGEAQLVPTWNYVAVHLRGELRLQNDMALREVLDRLNEVLEKRLAPKPPWKVDKIENGLLEKKMQHIVPIEMSVQSVDSTFKLNQNRSESARGSAAKALTAGGTPGMETRRLAALMEGVSNRSADD